MHPAPEHEPARVSIGLDVSAECRDGEHRVAHGGAGGKRSLGHGPEDLELCGGECGGGWRSVIAPREMWQKEEAPRDWGKDGERVSASSIHRRHRADSPRLSRAVRSVRGIARPCRNTVSIATRPSGSRVPSADRASEK